MEKPSISTLAAVVSLAIASASTSAGVIGFLGKFEGINDTGGTAHGFELELEGLHFNDITDTFGGLSKGGAVLPAPAGNVIPAAPVPGLPPASPVVVVAQMQAPAPVIQARFGEAIWVKVFTTELPEAVKLEDWVAGNPKFEGANAC